MASTSSQQNKPMPNDAQQNKPMPNDAQVIMSILKDMGINEYEPNVVPQLLEFTYRYVTTTLEDAQAYSQHAGKKGMDLEDVQLAVQMQLDKNFTTPPPRDLLLEVARSKNTTPLPLIKPHCGIRLPPDRFCMTGSNFELKTGGAPQPPKEPAATLPAKVPEVVTLEKKEPVKKVTPGGPFGEPSQWKPVNTPAADQAIIEVIEIPATVTKRKRHGDD